MAKFPVPGALEIKIATVVAVAATLHDADPAALDAALAHMTAGDAAFFDREFAVFDVAPLVSTMTGPIDWDALITLFRRYSLNPVAVRNAPPAMQAGILASGLSIDNSLTRPHAVDVPPPAPRPVPAPVSAAAVSLFALVIDVPVRAGQRIYARGTDLIVTAAVNNGAELIADGSIHVYAPLRGRALAGASGNAEARIFAMSMEAELVSIAGVYRTFDDGFPDGVANQSVQVRLAGDRLDLVALHAAAR
ncbi:MAG: septum site-determining protein MinC [Herminiimonas sp.]|nr:septum site-determining protein MinC [Herminiimonas sp.]